MRSGSPTTRAVAVGCVLSIAAAVGVAGCDVPRVAAEARQMGAVEAYLSQLEIMADVLGEVVDTRSARAAAPRIREIAGEIAQIRDRIGQLSAVDRDAVAYLYGQRLTVASESLRRETVRIGREPGLVGEVQEALAAVPPLD